MQGEEEMGFLCGWVVLILCTTVVLGLLRPGTVARGLRDGLVSFGTTVLVMGAVALVALWMGR